MSYFLLAIVLTSLSCVFYLIVLLSHTSFGFPLDDSWIHLEFARSVYEGRAWQYSPGWPSTGSTSPLWAIILSPLFLFSSEPSSLILGTYLVSAAFYVASTLLVGLLCRKYTDAPVWGYVGMIGFVLIPRNTWLMLSGMETPLFIFLILLGAYLMEYEGPSYDVILGVLAGLLFLTRPEGVLFALLCLPARFLTVVLKRELSIKRFGSFVLAVAVASVIALLWVLYCYSVTGHPLPDTFYAKTHTPTELEINAWNGWWTATILQMPFIILGFTLGLILLFQGRPSLWLVSLGLAVLYRLFMPYQSLVNNNRYVAPIYVLLFVIAVAGLGIVVEYIKNQSPDSRIDAPLSLISIFMILILLFPMIRPYGNQAIFLGQCVKNINEMQVTIGLWVDENTPHNASLAVSDAGAIRFLGNRAIFDLAGLMSPEINHGNFTFLETFQYLRNNSVEYAVTWTYWFEFWARQYHIPIRELYQVELTDNVICAGDTMSVFYLYWNRTFNWP